MRSWLVLVAACAPHSQSAPSSHPSGPVEPAKPIRAVDTRVIQLAADQAAAVLVGPWLVTSINPGGVELAISPDGRCDDGTWFDYTGGGVAVPAAETLCAR